MGELQLPATVGMIQCIPNEELRESVTLNPTDSARLTPNVASRNRKHLHLNTLPWRPVAQTGRNHCGIYSTLLMHQPWIRHTFDSEGACHGSADTCPKSLGLLCSFSRPFFHLPMKYEHAIHILPGILFYGTLKCEIFKSYEYILTYWNSNNQFKWQRK